VNLFDTDGLTGEDGAEMNLLPDAAAIGL